MTALRRISTSLIGNVDFLARYGAGDDVIADLQGDAERLGRLVDDLLALERETGAPARVIGEPDALARSFENLLDNAAVHGPADGRITISLGIVNGQAEVAVTDEGSGFPPGSEVSAFERFWRAEESRGRSGSGIGLAIVKAKAERPGGAVRAEGSTVTITPPVASPAATSGPRASPNGGGMH